MTYPFQISANKIEVINNRPTEKQEFNITDVLKNLISNDTTTTVVSDSTSGQFLCMLACSHRNVASLVWSFTKVL